MRIARVPDPYAFFADERDAQHPSFWSEAPESPYLHLLLAALIHSIRG
jgi:hypothetical protein